MKVRLLGEFVCLSPDVMHTVRILLLLFLFFEWFDQIDMNGTRPGALGSITF